MTRGFQLGLTLLVLINLLFVQLTGAVAAHWLIPLYLLTAAAPLLTGLHGDVRYRVAWNVGVLSIFAILVVDARTTGPAHLLEDGLILAAFCQVHLLNVVRRMPRADLLFFNSFLIALVTSFFCQDLAYSLTFAVWVAVFLLTLQANTLIRVAATLPPHAWRIALRTGALRTATALTVTMLVFLLWPRDFSREGWIGERWRGLHAARDVGFTEQVVLGRSAHTTLSDRVVMQITVKRGARELVPSHWRGAVLDRFDSRGWRSSSDLRGRSVRLDEPWIRRGDTWLRGRGPAVGSARVAVLDRAVRKLFTPLASNQLAFEAGVDRDSVAPLHDGTIGYRGVNEHGAGESPLTYVVDWGGERVEELPDEQRPGPVDLLAYRELSPRTVPDSAYDLVQRVVGDLGPGARKADIVERCRSHLAENFDYLLPGQQGAAGDLEEFLSGDAGGHCEYFATALAVLLRLRGVPCRVVTGYVVDEWDAERGVLTVRARHAHAWVEAWDDARGWYTVDATPAATRTTGRSSRIAEWGRSLAELWRRVTRFDARDRARALAWVADLPARVARAVAEHPLWTLAMLAIATALLALWRSLRRGDASLHAYRVALRRAGIARLPNETPRELLARAADLELAPERLASLRDATAHHEAARYATLAGRPR